MAQKFLNGIDVSSTTVVNGSNLNSGSTVLDVQGSQGQLFSVTNSLTGDLFSVSDISGVPILNVNSSGAVNVDGTLTVGGSITTVGGNIIAGGAVYPASNASASLGLSNKQWAGLDLSSSSAITWGNGDAEIIEGETNNYSLTFKTYDGTNNSAALRLDGDNTATFAGDIKQGNRIVLQDNGTIQWGSAADYGNLTWDTGYALIYGQSGKGIKFATNGSTLALTLDTSQNATFAGTVSATNLSGTNTGDQDLSTYSLTSDTPLFTWDSTANLASPSASTGTWTTGTTTDWGTPRIGSSVARYNDGTGTLSFAVPTGMKTAYISQLTWSSGGYMDVYGVQSDGGEVFLRRINTKQTVENTNEGNPNQHDGSTIVFAGHIGDYPTILLHNKVGRFHPTGLGFSKSEVGASEGTGIVNYSQLTGSVPTWNQNTTGNADTVTTNANLTGHVTSSGNAALLGSFTVAQLSTALSDATISGNNSGDQTLPTDFVSAANGGTFADSISVHGNILLTGAATTTNRSRMIDFTGFDKESTTDFTDRAYISHTANTGGHTGSVLVISSQNDANDGIAFATNASSNLKHNSNVIWTAGNDGSGSGLDADLLDGQHASAFQAAGSYQASGNYITGTGSLSAQDLTDIGNLSGTNTGDQTTLPATTSDMLDFFQDNSGVSLHQFNNSLNDVGGNYNATSTGASYGTGLDTRFGTHGINTQGDGTYVDIAGLPQIQAVSIWYKAIGNDNGYIVDFRHDNTGNGRSYLYTLAGSDQYINMGNDTTTSNQTGDIWINGVAFTSGQFNFTSGNWYHIVITTNATNTKQTWDQGIRIGNRSDGTTNGNAGYFDQVRTFNRRLTSTDVALLYSEVETGATADQTAGEILSLIKTVDGSGSGLDADLLDGNQATAFATSAQGTTADNALPKAGGTMTGNIHCTDPTTAGTSAKVQFGTNTSWNNNIGIEAYWMVLGCNQNEGFKLEDSTGNMLLQLHGGNSSSGNGVFSATFKGSINVNTNGLIKYEENTDVDSSSAEAVASVVKATYTAAFFDFVIKNGANVRAGIVYACHDGTNVEYAETSTVDLGDTSDVVLSVDISGVYMRLIATAASNDWIVKSLIRAI